jgi:hypothetical protein
MLRLPPDHGALRVSLLHLTRDLPLSTLWTYYRASKLRCEGESDEATAERQTTGRRPAPSTYWERTIFCNWKTATRPTVQNKANLGQDGGLAWGLRGTWDMDTLATRPDGDDRRDWRFDSRVGPERCIHPRQGTTIAKLRLTMPPIMLGERVRASYHLLGTHPIFCNSQRATRRPTQDKATLGEERNLSGCCVERGMRIGWMSGQVLLDPRLRGGDIVGDRARRVLGQVRAA